MARIQSKGVSQRLQELLEGLERGLEEGLIPAGIFNDPELFKLEASRIFSRSWVYLAHVSEIPSLRENGDWKVARRLVILDHSALPTHNLSFFL